MSRAAYSLVELLACLSLALILTGAGAPMLFIARDSARASGAADYLVAQIHVARLEALKRCAHVALRFEPDAGDYRIAMYVDGNGNGVRATDITDGVDRPLRPPERLDDRFAGVSFGFEDNVPEVESGTARENSDPVKVGRSRMISFGPTGTASTGTVYLRGRGRYQFAVRVLGVTGRVRCLSFDFGAGQWQPR